MFDVIHQIPLVPLFSKVEIFDFDTDSDYFSFSSNPPSLLISFVGLRLQLLAGTKVVTSRSPNAYRLSPNVLQDVFVPPLIISIHLLTPHFFKSSFIIHPSSILPSSFLPPFHSTIPVDPTVLSSRRFNPESKVPMPLITANRGQPPNGETETE